MANLKDINKNNNFEVPENYFNDFTYEIQTKIFEENLKNKFGNENPFSVPENYFHNFKVKKDRELSISNFQKLKPYLALAAAIALVLTIWQVTLSIIDNHSNTYAEKIDTILTFDNSSIAENIDFTDIELTENEIDLYLNETDENTLLTLDNTEDNSISLNIEDEIIYDYLIDYSDDLTQYDEVLAQL